MKDSFTLLYDQFFDDVYRYILYKVGKKWDADDLVSEVFRKAFEWQSSLRKDSNGKAWLMTIARNTLIDYYRKKRNVIYSDQVEDYMEHDVFTETGDLDEQVECVKKSLAFIPEEDREVINMRYFADMKYRDIGKVLGKTEQAIRTRMFRLTKKMGVLVTKCLEGVREHG